MYKRAFNTYHGHATCSFILRSSTLRSPSHDLYPNIQEHFFLNHEVHDADINVMLLFCKITPNEIISLNL